MNIFVANLCLSTTSKELQKLFAHYGSVDTVKVIIDHSTGKSRIFYFVEMPNNYEANEAFKELNSKILQEYPIYIKYSQPKSYRIWENEGANRNSSTPSSETVALRKYNRNSKSINKPQCDPVSLRNFGYKGSGYKGFDHY